jgi:hypothetical protein
MCAFILVFCVYDKYNNIMCMSYKQTPENNEGTLKKREQSRETGNTGYTRQRKTIQKYNTK